MYFCGPSMVFTNVYNPRSAVSRKDEYRDTVIEQGVTLGANCTIVCGCRVGHHSFVGAGTVVNRDVKPFCLSCGSASQANRLDECLWGASGTTS